MLPVTAQDTYERDVLHTVICVSHNLASTEQYAKQNNERFLVYSFQFIAL